MKQSDSFLNKGVPSPSIHNYIDVALLQNKRVALPISTDEYIRLTAALGPILDDERILLLGNKNIDNYFVQGLGSVYEKLTHKFTSVQAGGFQGVVVCLFIKSQKNINYYELTKSYKILKTSTYQNILDALNVVNYEQVQRVQDVGQFCIKGGVIDLFSPLYSRPIRICLYEGEESIKFYSLESGLSGENELKQFHLNQESKSVQVMSVESLLRRAGFSIMNNPIQLINKVKIFGYESLYHKKNNKQVIWSDKIYFSGYKYNGKYVVPKIYKKKPPSLQAPSIPTLEIGDYVCHEDFGVGILKGFVDEHKQYKEESIKIEYQDGQILLSASNLHKISVVSRETNDLIKVNSLSRLGYWKKTKKSIEKSVEANVQQVIDLYREKKETYREPFCLIDSLETPFIDSFPHIDTPDQKGVWAEIKQDLESSSPMYRLLCGDVGFGKTEIAMRVVFRVASNNKKSIVLVPTSVLAVQHYNTFKGRLGSFGVNVALLTSATTNKEKESIKLRWLEGVLDVLITTTAVMYDVDFIRFASCFVVDEEHRFGVKDKEVVLNQFSNKDVLFMSATPIPRSLHLSLSGINSISTLASPPALRLPIQTFVVVFNKEIIKQAIDFELSRGGQVFFVHNRINTIGSVCNYLQALCPYASFSVAHSKVATKTLKGRVSDFVRGKTQVLVCTSIVGSGIDIPNTNTILINKAHHFGLSQLHQIRGRVGRSNAQAFAYLLVPEGKKITPKGLQRLKTISTHTSLGSGYQIAKSDMQIRGGGTVFGYSQSGKNLSLGYDYYSKIIGKKVSESLQNSFFENVDKFVYKVGFLCFFSKQYIPQNNYRLAAYKELGGLYDKNKILNFKKRLINVYGKLPLEGNNLINLRLAVLCVVQTNITSFSASQRKVVFVFGDRFKETSLLFGLLKTKGLGDCVEHSSFKTLKQGTALELVINKGVILDGYYVYNLAERLCSYVKV